MAAHTPIPRYFLFEETYYGSIATTVTEYVILLIL